MRQVGQQKARSQDHLPSCWYAKSANGHVHDLHFSSWKVGAEACIMDFVEVHNGCPSSEKIPGLVGEIQRVWAKNSPIFSVFCVFQQHRCVTLGLLYDWSLQLSKLAWNANFSSCCLFSKFSRCRMKKKMMMVMMVIIVMTMMTTMTTKTSDAYDVGFVGLVLPFKIMLKGTTSWSSSSGYVRRLRGWCRFLKVGWHMKFLLQLECHIFFWGRNIQLGEHRIMWPDFPEHGSSIVWIQPGFLTILSDPKIDGQVHEPIWYLVSSCNAQPSSSGGFFRVRKSCTMKFGKTKGFGQASSSGDTTEVFQHNESLLPHLPAKKLSWSWGTWSIYFHANLVVFFVFFVIFGDTVEQNSAHQLIYQNKFMKCRQLHPQKFTRNMQKEP